MNRLRKGLTGTGQCGGVGKVIALAGLLLGMPGMVPLAQSEDLYAVVIGIDDYIGKKNDLQGAAADARDIAGALRLNKVRDMAVIINKQATHAAIEAAWRRMVAQAKKGDTIVFSYAGHGDQEPEPPGRNGEADGMNENFLLAGYEVDGPGKKERIVDDEMFQWLKMADDKGIKVVFIADSCHSGTMYRSLGNIAVTYRKWRKSKKKARKKKRRDDLAIPDISADDLALPPAQFATATPDDFQNVTFVAATQENRLVPEVVIDGQKRGALSWAFARALEGKADDDKNGKLSQLELQQFLVPAVRQQVGDQQAPQIVPFKTRKFEVITLRSRQVAVEKKPKPQKIAADMLRVYAPGGEAALRGIDGVVLVQAQDQAELVWNVKTGQVIHVPGGRVADKVGPHNAPYIISKYAALKWLVQHADGRIDIALPLGLQRYAINSKVQFKIENPKRAHMTVFNIMPNGRVQFFIPDPRRPLEAQRDWRHSTFSEFFRVDVPPFGSENLVAIFTDDILKDLHALLAVMNSPAQSLGLRSSLRKMLKGHKYQLGTTGIYTGNE